MDRENPKDDGLKIKLCFVFNKKSNEVKKKYIFYNFKRK